MAMRLRLTYAGTCMGHEPRPSGAPKAWLPGSIPSSCRLTTIWDSPKSPLGLPGRYGRIADVLSVAGVLLAVGAAAGAVAGLASRWRRGGPRVRQQLLLLALAACPPALVLMAVIIANGVPGWVFGVVLLPVPIAIAFAILGHGLYDLRHAAHQTLLWLAMSETVVGIYALVVTAAVALVPDHHGWWPSAVAAAIAALLLIPCAKRCSAPLAASSTAAGTSRTRFWPA
jgi:hypothetical protein